MKINVGDAVKHPQFNDRVFTVSDEDKGEAGNRILCIKANPYPDPYFWDDEENFKRRSHYNDAPPGLKEIALEEFTKGIFHYCIKQPESKQVTVRDENGNRQYYYDLRLFPVPNFDDEELGYAIKNDWKNKRITFHRYGEDDKWNKFENHFAAQFAGDNS